jgi:hypothetical protein
MPRWKPWWLRWFAKCWLKLRDPPVDRRKTNPCAQAA